MPIVSVGRRVLALAGLVGLAACAGTATQAPLASSALARLVPRAANANLGGSWMAPEAKKQALLYVSEYPEVEVYSYRRGVLLGELTGFDGASGLCSDRNGNVFVTDLLARTVYEYAHGGTAPIASFDDIYVDFNPEDCSVDPTTGNLAVVSLDAPYVVIFPKARNRPKVFSDLYAILFDCVYDSRGNLYVDQVIHRHRFYIGVRSARTGVFKNFLLDRRAGYPGSIQFDGRYVVVDDLHTNVLHQLRFSGSNATVIGSTPLRDAKDVRQFWIYRNRIVGPDLYGTVYFWEYPTGGISDRSIRGSTEFYGSTVSVIPGRKPNPRY